MCRLFGVSTGAGFRGCRTCGVPALVLLSCVPSFCPSLSLCLWCVVFEICLYSRFKGVFSGFRGFRVGLCGLRALRGLWGFCVRVELGGLEACCVFAPVFHLLPISFCLSFCLFAPVLSLCISSWLCLCCPRLVSFVALSLCLLFPFRTIRKKKGRKGFARCVLSCPVMCV